jgi:hypothetical protein
MARPQSNRLAWKGAGYHAFPLAGKPDPDRDAHLWRDFERVLGQARRGDFAAVPDLVDLYDQAESWLLARAYVTLLGDAGTPAAFARVLPVVVAQEEPTYQVQLSEALTTWGKLAVIPVILAGWETLEGFNDADAIPGYLSRVLEEQPGPVAAADRADTDGYRARVMGRYAELVARHGSADVLLFRGSPVSVRKIAGLILDDLAAGDLDPYLRRRFEATTGIDCSSFYEDGSLRPLAAAAAVEQFLEGPEPAKYEDGVRYFFGHRIPD